MTAAVLSGVVETKRMLKAAQEASGVPIKAAHQAMGVSYPYLADSLNEAEPQRLPLDLLVPFMKVTGSLEPVRWLAGQLGGVFVELPRLVTGAEDIYSTFLKAVSEVGEDSAAIERALSDREITDSEGQTLAAELDDTIAALVAVKLAVLAKAGKPLAARMTIPAATVEQRRRA